MPKVALDTNVVYIDIDVADPEKALLLYNKIQVWRSPDNIASYTEVTAPTDLPAKIDGTVDGPWNLSTKTLTIVKNGADPISIIFTGTDPFDLLSIIKKINLVIPKLASQTGPNINRLTLTSDMVGLSSSLTISGDAAPILGLSTIKAIGRSHRIDLTSPTNKYRFYDLDGLPTYYYKVRFSNSFNGAVSSFSNYIRATIDPVLNPSDLVTASIRLSDSVGMPIEGRRIIIVPITTRQVNGAALLNSTNRIILTTNQFGFASTQIAKGITAKVFFEGTGFEREIVVPTTDFDILTVASQYPDPFTIVTSPPLAIRVS